MSNKSEEKVCLALICSRDSECFCGLVPIRLGVVIVSAFTLVLLLVLLVFNVVSLIWFGNENLPELAWHPHPAVLFTLILISIIIYNLALGASLNVLREYADACYIIFMVVNIVVLLFHLFFAIIALGLGLSLHELLIEASNHGNTNPWKLELFQYGRSALYFIVSFTQIYAEFVVTRARLHWVRHEKDHFMYEEMARQKSNPPKQNTKKKKTNKVASVKFDPTVKNGKE